MAEVTAEMSDAQGIPANFLGLTAEELAALPHDDKSKELLASVWSLFAVASIFLALRVYCRLLTRRQNLWWDDWVLIASWVCILITTSIQSYLTTLGYGKHSWDIDPANIQAMMLPMLVSGTFSVTAAVWSKTSFAITLMRITDGWIKNVAIFAIVSMNIFMGLSGLFSWIRCKPLHKAWDLTVPFEEGTCWAPEVLERYDIFSSSFSAFMDIALAILPWKFLWGLQMQPREKIGVGIAMSMGVFAGATAVVKTTKLPGMASADLADGIKLWIWGNAETCASIIAASIPMLRVLVRDVKSSRGYQTGYANNDAGLTGNYSRFVTITSKPARVTSDIELHKMDDDGSDRSILGGNNNHNSSNNHNHQEREGGVQPKNRGIVQVTEITVKYGEGEGEGEEIGGAQASSSSNVSSAQNGTREG